MKTYSGELRSNFVLECQVEFEAFSLLIYTVIGLRNLSEQIFLKPRLCLEFLERFLGKLFANTFSVFSQSAISLVLAAH